MLKPNFTIKALLAISILALPFTAFSQNNTGYYSSDINKAIKAKKKRFKAIPKNVKNLPKLNKKQLASVTIQGDIDTANTKAKVAPSKTELSKTEINQLELIKNNETSPKNDTGLVIKSTPVVQYTPSIAVKSAPIMRKGAYQSSSYMGSFYNIRGEAQINARKLD